jgi:hypothetical protein
VGFDVFTEPALALEQAAKAGDTARITVVMGVLRGLAGRVVAPDEG